MRGDGTEGHYLAGIGVDYQIGRSSIAYVSYGSESGRFVGFWGQKFGPALVKRIESSARIRDNEPENFLDCFERYLRRIAAVNGIRLVIEDAGADPS